MFKNPKSTEINIIFQAKVVEANLIPNPFITLKVVNPQKIYTQQSIKTNF